jgi:hypothetical protein
MTQFICWVAFPLVVALLSLGCGWLLEWGCGRPLPEGLLLPAGLALIVVVAEITTKSSWAAKVTTPLVVVLAVVGLALARPWRRGLRLGGWPLGVAAFVYVAYLAPVLATGEPTFTGYIKLDDTSTWMAMTDRVLSSGHSLAGLAPSTYEATLNAYLTGGEPVGAMLPWGIGRQIVGQDLAWVFQPQLALCGAMLAMSAWALVGPLVRSRALRAAIAFVASQAAITYGYSLWGGIKEVSAAWVLACSVACVIPVLESNARIRSFIPLAAATFAMLGVFGFGGAVWLAATLVAVGLYSLRAWLGRHGRLGLAGLAALIGVLAFVLIRGAENFARTNGALTGAELGNLAAPLRGIQILGIWPAGDFRVNPPDSSTLTHVLVYVVVLGVCLCAIAAVRRRWWVLLLYPGGAALGVALTYWKGSPWVVGKALATASPALLLVGLAGMGALVEAPSSWIPWERHRRDGGGLARSRQALATFGGVAICAGVLWSNLLAYHHVTIAPYGQLSELAQIGHRFAGDGPALINEYEPYAARHFLRAMDPESPSELRRRLIPLRGGGEVQKGGYADLDEFQIGALLVYRTIVIRTSPAASRPPAPYQLVWAGRWYQVWRRPVMLSRPIVDSVPLGNSVDPTGVPACSDVLRLAREARAGGLLAAVARPAPTVMTVPSPLPPRDTNGAFAVAEPGPYRVWLGGSFVRRLRTSVDGVSLGSMHEVLNEAGDWTPLGTIRLRPSAHRIKLSYGDAQLYPGSGGGGRAGPIFPVGPLAIAPVTGRLPVTYFAPAKARALCGRRWDWVEALGS